MARDHIYVNGLRLMALVGVLPHEREGEQPVQVDIDLEVDLAEAGLTDNLVDTANYGAIAEAVSEVVRMSSDVLLERLVARIAERCLQFDHVEVADVRLTKLRPPISENLDSTAVRIVRSRVDMKIPARHRAIVALGSNLGDRVAYLRFGLERLSNVVAQSQVFETDPVGGPDNQGPYLNMVAVIDTDLDPYAMLRRLLQIEAEAHRVRIERWGPRTLDLDLLFYDDVTINSEELIVPHPRFAERRFVLEPLSEVASEHCPSQWRNRLPAYGVYPRGPIDGLVAHVSLS
ncbi:MAG: 2-amino-4-hydroxy-6-hydroxymethyldihydropteridine diphosphokinase [Ilumatobacteraceae bacterium]|jgi:dihydroneopterin aldolase/2-amino-4-hydroxy-6-hydroxymethyldihydropteridine diphosphokinase|nr:2-amino-4-hydroxy-6-hydroxymethyldihydropteridine diphosphokinase [Ilumatobacteraceae bacterium]